ncbi:MAG: 4-(cytidine 5'-diphospho)-2-C-methyl-D-erythritol kinase [Clostridiales bacterium]|nr:4-(cytidine 5'-diphospho)-2-C-methyl-D-erythritol kinase [Clostridiales bacterium]
MAVKIQHGYAPAKINWFLRVLHKRKDGYHNIDTVMQTVSLFDELTVTLTGGEDTMEIVDELGNRIESIPTDKSNLVFKAAGALGVKGVHVRLVKRIPSCAGMGGGSSDAACALKIFNSLFELGHSNKELEKIALTIGSDVPFFINGGIQRVVGKGEVCCGYKAREYELVVIKPSCGINTGEAYRYIDSIPRNSATSSEHFMKEYSEGRYSFAYAINEFELPALAMNNEIEGAMNVLKGKGASHVCLAGSGSCVFGVFEGADIADAVFFELKNCGYEVYRAKTTS